MPQDFPLEASETITFTPECFAPLGESAPVFTLRTPTYRHKRDQRRLQSRLNMRYHGKDAVRDELRRALSALWSADEAAAHLPRIEQYWEHLDAFEQQREDQPDLEWDFDKDAERVVLEVLDRAARAWDPLLEMQADNNDFGQMLPLIWIVTVVEGWTGLSAKVKRSGGYVELDSIEAMTTALRKLAEKHKIVGEPVLELANACVARMNIDEEESGNSESPSPSETIPAASSPTKTADMVGQSPESTARSNKTPVAA